MSDAFSMSPFIKSSSHPCFSSIEDDKSYFQDDCENFLRVSRKTSPPLIFEMVFEKPQESSSFEENMRFYDEEAYFRNSQELNFFGDANLIKQDSFEAEIARNGAMIEEEEDGSECSRKETDEELASISTKESLFAGFTTIDSDTLSQTLDENFSSINFYEIEARMQAKAFEIGKNKTRQEKEYIEMMLPSLIESIKSMYSECSCSTLTDNMLETVFFELLDSKKALLGAEAQFLRSLVGREINDIQKERPSTAIGEDDLNVNRRKARKTLKGNKNNSTLNHVNENYVSNIFQFAKKNFPEDAELQRLANERNVSALHFRRFMHCRMTDTTLRRRAKTRMIESGKELLNNIEYWMNEGYFDQCTEREKYIAQKQKALLDLALDEKY